MYNALLSEGRIGNVAIKNRMVMSPMGVNIEGLDGRSNEEELAYFEARAKGGCGLIIVGVVRVNDVHGNELPRQLSATSDDKIDSIRALADRIHPYGTKIFCQLQHPGREIEVELQPGQEFVVSASDKACKVTNAPTRALSTEEVRSLIGDFVDAAKRCKEAGMDGVELHAGHGYLLQQFISPYTNNRTDEYGGSVENRCRMVTEIIKGIHKECGDDYPVGVRVTVEEFLSETGVTEPSLELPEGCMVCRILEDAGADYLNVTVGLYETGIFSVEPLSFPEGWRHDILQAVRESVSIPLVAVSAFRTPAVMEQFLEEGVIDFCASGRCWLADPEYGKKIAEGREDEIRGCIGCMRCIASVPENALIDQPCECSVNPEACREYKYGPLPSAEEGKHVLIIGAGPSGLKAAETLARRGIRVTVADKHGDIGGTMHYQAAVPPHKDRYNRLMGYFKKQFELIGNIELMMDTVADIDLVKELDPDAVIVATGSIPLIPKRIPGHDNPVVKSVEDVLEGHIAIEGKNVIVIGSGLTGIETAEFLCDTNNVTIADMADKIGKGAAPGYVADVAMHLEKAEVPILLGHTLKEICDDHVVVEDLATNEEKVLPADAVILALGSRTDSAFPDELKEAGFETYTIGSALKDGTIVLASRAGYELGRQLFA